MSDLTDLVRLQRELAEERRGLRLAALVIAYSGAWFALGLAIGTTIQVGLVLLALSLCGLVGGATWTMWYGARTWKYSREIRAVRQLPTARLLER